MKHGFGIIGTGAIADFHAKSISEIPDARLVAVLDTNPEKAKLFSKKYNCLACSTPDELTRNYNIDIICICTPSGLHLDPALEAIGAGKHCIIEKPLEITPERCDMIISAAHSKGVLIEGIFPSRFYNAAKEIKKAADQNRFGKFTMGNAYIKWYRTQEYYDSVKWRGTWKYDGGGALMNQGIHSIDLLQWFMGPVKRVQALTSLIGHKNIEVEDTAVAMIEFSNSALGTIEGSTAVFPGSYKRVEVLGTEGSAVLEENRLAAWNFMKETDSDTEIRNLYTGSPDSGGGVSDPLSINYLGHKYQIEDMIRAVDTGCKPLVTGEEARKSVQIIDAVYQSARSGKPVDIS